MRMIPYFFPLLSDAVPPCYWFITLNSFCMDRNEKALVKFGLHLAGLRQQKGMTVQELASRSHLDPRHISRIEAGQVNLLFSTILALSRGLGVPPEELLETL
jgi:DNA-binding Xre family transcriptional regulator